MHALCPERWTLGLGGPGSLSASRGLGKIDQHPEGGTEKTLHLVWLQQAVHQPHGSSGPRGHR